MSVARKDDKHNEDLVGEIADSFTRALNDRDKHKDENSGAAQGESAERPRFVVTGDKRTPPPKNPHSR